MLNPNHIKVLTVRIPKELWEAVREYAKEDRRSVNQFIELILTQFVNRQLQNEREANK